MTALPAVKREALRFRIWQFAAPREWDVTVLEIAEAIGESSGRVRQMLRYAGWANRVRVQTPEGIVGRWQANARAATGGVLVEHPSHVIADVLAGRVNSEFAA